MSNRSAKPFRVTRGLTWSLFWRSLFVQAVWNYKGMQHIGLLWSMLPGLRRIKGNHREIMLRGVEFYNAHPFLSGFLAGASLRMEHEQQGVLLSRLKRAAVAPLGATGDRLFWSHLKPLTGMLCVTGLLLLLLGWAYCGLTLCALGILAWNLPHLYIRYFSVETGLRRGKEVHLAIRGLHDSRWLHGAHNLHQFFTGLFLVLFPCVLLLLLSEKMFPEFALVSLLVGRALLLFLCCVIAFWISLKLSVSRSAFHRLLLYSVALALVLPEWVARLSVYIENLLR